MPHFTITKSTTVILLLIFSGERLAAACPSGCRCDDVNYDGDSGTSVQCEKLYRRYLPNSVSSSSFELHFSFNDFRYLPRRLQDFIELRVLDLSYNKLQVLPNDTFSRDHKLREFNLSNNYLHIVNSRAFNGLRHLRVLDLERNELKTIPGDVFVPLTYIMSSGGEIYLSRNRWQCNCTIVDFMTWFLDHQLEVSWSSTMGDEETVCRTPESLYSRRLDSLSLSELGNCFGVSSTVQSSVSSKVATTMYATTEEVTTSTPTPVTRPPVWPSVRKENAIPTPKKDYSQNNNPSSYWGLPTQDFTFIAMGTIVFIVLSVLIVFGVLLWKVAKRQRYPIGEEYGDVGGNRWKSKVISLHSKRCQLPLPDEPCKLPANTEYDFIPAEFPSMMIQAAGTYSERIIDNSSPGHLPVTIRAMGGTKQGDDFSHRPKETNEYTKCDVTYGRSIVSEPANQQYEDPKLCSDKQQYQSTIYALSRRESPSHDQTTYLPSDYEDMKSLI